MMSSYQTIFGGYTLHSFGSSAPDCVLLLLHGRGATAQSIMRLTERLGLPESCLVVAPQAPNNTWYPQRFMVAQSENEPYLSNAITMVDDVISNLEKTLQLTSKEVFLAGFSQGGCLVSEYLKQHPRQYRGAAIMSGGLIGTDEEVGSIVSDSQLSQTPVYLGCDKVDDHIPANRVIVTGDVLTKLGATVSLRLYENIGHTVHPEAFEFISKYLIKE